MCNFIILFLQAIYLILIHKILQVGDSMKSMAFMSLYGVRKNDIESGEN